MPAKSEKIWSYMVVWEFRPKPGAEQRFEEAYGADGIWAGLFQQSEGFVATELSRDREDPRRYLTLDFWESRAAYERFRSERAADYAAIDARCESLTEFEREMGQFEKIIR
jgi:heme-degrading monooxygenase HmoA